MDKKIIITLTSGEVELILSSLGSDRVGKWGDGRQERIDSLTDKIKKTNRVKEITGFTK